MADWDHSGEQFASQSILTLPLNFLFTVLIATSISACLVHQIFFRREQDVDTDYPVDNLHDGQAKRSSQQEKPTESIVKKDLASVGSSEDIAIRRQSERSDSSDTSVEESDSHVSEDSQAEANAGAPHLPYLKIPNQIKGAKPERLLPNAAQGQELTSDNISGGKIVFALRLKDQHGKDVENYPYYDAFFRGKKRNLQMQMQIRLKSEPKGIIYAGGEIRSSMHLGLLTKGFCKIIVAVTNRISTHSHCGFGRHMKDPVPERENPHICFPLFAAATKLVVTKAGDTPPVLGEEIPETPEEKKKRKAQAVNVPGQLKAGDTITFSLHTMYVDFLQWKVVNIPGLKDMDLRMFWDTKPLCISIYDTRSDVPEKFRHLNKNKFYYSQFEMVNTTYKMTKDGDRRLFWFPQSDMPGSADVNARRINSSVSDSAFDFEKVDKSGGQGMEDMVEVALRVPAVVEHCVITNGKAQKIVSLALLCHCKTQNETSTCMVRDFESFANLDLPSSIRDIVHKNEYKQSLAYPWKIENLRSKLDFGLSNCSESLYVPSKWITVEPSLLAADEPKQIGVTLSSKLLKEYAVLFQCPILHAEKEIKWTKKWLTVLQKKIGEGINSSVIALFDGSTTKPTLVINCKDILKVGSKNATSALNTNHVPFSKDFPTLEVETVGRVYLFGCKDAEVKVQLEENINLCGIQGTASMNSRIEIGDSATDVANTSLLQEEDLLSKYVDVNDMQFQSQKRVIMNVRRLHFGCFPTNVYFHKNDEKCFKRVDSFQKLRNTERRRSLIGKWFAVMFDEESESESSQAKLRDLTPWEYSTELLRATLKVSTTPNPTVADFVEMSNLASGLKSQNLAKWSSRMSEEQRMCFFLNVYHSLRIHASFILGAPSSLYGWSSFGRKASYVIGGMVFSLAEIEHCILRYPLSKAKFLFMDITYTSTPFTELFKLKKKEPRISLVLNHGTMSNAIDTPVFVIGKSTEGSLTFDEQLAEAASKFLEDQFVVNLKEKRVKIPKVCYWYAKDFLGLEAKDTSKRALAHSIFPYLGKSQKECFTTLCTQSDFSVKIRSFHFTPRDQNPERQASS